ncbi:hypothetical protein RFI_10295 [Reticulomyxa filosa]|uniref:Uncharacterized protein n=1 Tax=Reticulomyxa filosa TaxID=46433 RepID=X6NLH7_RETFI|nr:hypothetical protein RFI_10295 [Reticulomyxa filosa]|eukprot:ETO26841.1 hypothetical protein RFI_10295 [Reticulomyxa filosa]
MTSSHSTANILDLVCGVEETVLYSQTPTICRLLLSAPTAVSPKHPSCKKWLTYLKSKLRQLYNNLTVTTKEAESKDAKSDTPSKYQLMKELWTIVSLLSSTYRIVLPGDFHCIRQVCEPLLEIITYKSASEGQAKKKDSNKESKDKHPQAMPETKTHASAFSSANVSDNGFVEYRVYHGLMDILEYIKKLHKDTASTQKSNKVLNRFMSFLVSQKLLSDKSHDVGNVLSILHRVFTQFYTHSSDTSQAAKHLTAISSYCYKHLLFRRAAPSSAGDIPNLCITKRLIILKTRNNKKKNIELLSHCHSTPSNMSTWIEKLLRTIQYVMLDTIPKYWIASTHESSSQETMEELAKKGETQVHRLYKEQIKDACVMSDIVEKLAKSQQVLNGLFSLLCHEIRRKNRNTLEATQVRSNNWYNRTEELSSELTSQSDKGTGGGRRGAMKRNLTMMSELTDTSGLSSRTSVTSAMNGMSVTLPMSDLILLIFDVVSIGHVEDMTYRSLLADLYVDALWLLNVIVATFGRTLYPYMSLLLHILTSVNEETQWLRSREDYVVRKAMYVVLEHMVHLFGTYCYDCGYKDLKTYVLRDLVQSKDIVFTPPPTISHIETVWRTFQRANAGNDDLADLNANANANARDIISQKSFVLVDTPVGDVNAKKKKKTTALPISSLRRPVYTMNAFSIASLN